MVNRCLIISGIVVLLLSGCNSETDKSNSNFEKIYSALYLLHNSPDYPGSLMTFKACEKKTNEGCYKILQQVKKAKSELMKINDDFALKTTLSFIHDFCQWPVIHDDANEALCEGALNALYFFNQADDDIKILNHFKSWDKKINKRLFNRNREWFYNRKNRQPWRIYVKKMLEAEALELQMFRFNQLKPRPFGLMYLEDPIPEGNTLVY